MDRGSVCPCLIRGRLGVHKRANTGLQVVHARIEGLKLGLMRTVRCACAGALPLTQGTKEEPWGLSTPELVYS